MLLPSSDSPSHDDTTRYNYKFEIVDSFTGSDGYTVAAEDGNKFLIIGYRICNHGVKDGIPASRVSSSWILYDGEDALWVFVSDKTEKHPGYSSQTTISNGADISSVVIYELAENNAKAITKVVNTYMENKQYIHDESLTVDIAKS